MYFDGGSVVKIRAIKYRKSKLVILKFEVHPCGSCLEKAGKLADVHCLFVNLSSLRS